MIRLDFDASPPPSISAEVWAAIRPRLALNMKKAVLVLESSFKRTVGGVGKGRLYPKGIRFFTWRGRVIPVFDEFGRAAAHRASAPGDPPARDFGDYTNSFGHAVEGETIGPEITGAVGSRMWDKRGKWLELGTRRMKPRPHVDRAINAVRDQLARVLGDF